MKCYFEWSYFHSLYRCQTSKLALGVCACALEMELNSKPIHFIKLANPTNSAEWVSDKSTNCEVLNQRSRTFAQVSSERNGQKQWAKPIPITNEFLDGACNLSFMLTIRRNNYFIKKVAFCFGNLAARWCCSIQLMLLTKWITLSLFLSPPVRYTSVLHVGFCHIYFVHLNNVQSCYK